MGLGDMLQAERDHEDAARYRNCNLYAESLVKSLAKRFPAVPTWQPLDDLMGKLTQIDNMTACLHEGYGSKAHVESDFKSPTTFTGWIQKPCENCGKSSRDHIGLSMACPHNPGADKWKTGHFA